MYFIWIEYAEIKMKIFYICAVIDIPLQLFWRKWQTKSESKSSQLIKLVANIICKSHSFTQSQYLTISDTVKLLYNETCKSENAPSCEKIFIH